MVCGYYMYTFTRRYNNNMRLLSCQMDMNNNNTIGGMQHRNTYR